MTSVIALRPHDLNIIHLSFLSIINLRTFGIRSPVDPSVFIGVDVERHLHVYSL